MSRVYLLRHGALETPGPGRRCVGRTNYDLSAQGRAQALALGSFFARHPVAQVYCSPLLRCVHTAQLCFGAQPLLLRPALQEVDMGQWDGLCFSEVQARWPELYARRGEDFCGTAAPGGESFTQAGERFCAEVDAIMAQAEGDLAIVAHAGVNRMLLCRLTGRPGSDLFAIDQPYGCINLLEAAEGRLRVLKTGLRPEEAEEYCL